MPRFLATSPGLDHHYRATWGVPSEQWKASQRRSALTPNNNVPTRKPRRLGPAKFSRRQLRPLRRHIPHLSKRPPTQRHLLMKPSLRTDRIANCCSSMPPSTGELQRLTGSHVLRPPLSYRRERLFLRPSFTAFRPISPRH